MEDIVTTLELDRVSKSYQELQAVSDLSLSLSQGQIFGLLGPNGAGKTTTIRMIMDIIKPDSGSIKILGQPSSINLRDKIGYLPEERGLFKKMKIIEAILFFAEIKSKSKKHILKQAEEWLNRFELIEWRDKKVEELSRGMQQKIQFICTILHEPDVVILDEPFTGLDPINTNMIKDVILELKQKGTSIIFSTHLMEQVEKLCDSICLINKGQSIVQGTLGEVKRKFGKNRVRMRYEGQAAFLKDKSLISKQDDYGKYVEILPVEGVSPQTILAAALQQVEVQLFEIADPSLNEIFISVVKN